MNAKQHNTQLNKSRRQTNVKEWIHYRIEILLMRPCDSSQKEITPIQILPIFGTAKI